MAPFLSIMEQLARRFASQRYSMGTSWRRARLQSSTLTASLQVTLAGPEVADAEGDYELGDLDGKTIEISTEPAWSFQVGADDVSQDRI